MMNRVVGLVIFAVAVLAGCRPAEEGTRIDLSGQLSVVVMDGAGKERRLAAEQEAEVARILRDTLPESRVPLDTYPTPEHRLRVLSGTNPTADQLGTVFVGTDWIGDGRSLASVPEEDMAKLHRIIGTSPEAAAP